jgi:hypothetical protein
MWIAVGLIIESLSFAGRMLLGGGFLTKLILERFLDSSTNR